MAALARQLQAVGRRRYTTGAVSTSYRPAGTVGSVSHWLLVSLAGAACLCVLAPWSHASVVAPRVLGPTDSDIATISPEDPQGNGDSEWGLAGDAQLKSKWVLSRKVRLTPPWRGPKRPPRGMGVERTTGPLPARPVAGALARVGSFHLYVMAEPARDGRPAWIRTSIRPMGP